MGLSNVYGVPGRVGSRPGRLIDGKAISAELRAETAAAVVELVEAGGRAPGLATILVGEDPASQVYVASKHRACSEAGIRSLDHRLPGDASAADLHALIDRLNNDDEFDGILLQLPLPEGLDADEFVDRIDPAKDVDGLTTVDVGLLWQGRRALAPCTPLGVIELLDRIGFDPAGREAVIVGRSDLVGKPLAAMLLARNATVTVCHSRTPDLAAHTRSADVVVAAVGRRGTVTGDMVKPGAVVIDVGMNRVPEGEPGAGKLCGDVDFASVEPVAGAITPVPGGVGPMTIAMLLANTVASAERAAASAPGHP